MDLYPHQRAAVDFLKSRERCCLADDQGLGKTISVAVALRELGVRTATIVAPSVALWNWQHELRLWTGRDATVIDSSRAADEVRWPVNVTSHALVCKPAVRAAVEGAELLVVDESQFFRTPSADRTRKLYKLLASHSRRVWCLTGTPAPNGHSVELWTMLHHLLPETFPESFTTFRDRYCLTAPTIYGDGWRVVKNQNTDELRRRMDGFMLRRRKTILGIPPKRVETVSVKPKKMPPGLAELERRLRRRARTADNIAAHDEVASAETPEEAFNAMRSHEDLSRFRRLSGLAKTEPAIELVLDEFRNGLDCIVLFAQHTEVIEQLRVALAAHRPVVVDGSVNARERRQAVEDFQAGRSNVFIGQITAAGTAITLTRACEALFVELSYTPGDNAQAADRIHRIGQTRPVRARFLSLAHSADEIIVDVVRKKVAMLQGLIA